MIKMYVGPHQAADLRNKGLWDSDTMTADKAEVAISANATIDAELSASNAGLMVPPVRSEIVVTPPSASHIAGYPQSAELQGKSRFGDGVQAAAPHEHADEMPEEPRKAGVARSERAAPSISDVSERLNERVEELARELLGEPNAALSTKTQIRYGNKGSLAIETDGTKIGQWYDHEEGAGGDALGLIIREKRMAVREAVDWAGQWLGMPRRARGTVRQRPVALESAVSQGAVSATQEPTADDRTDGANKVAKIVASAVAITGTPGELYLRNRGITSAPPDCVRYLPGAFGQYGAVVAQATDAAGEVLALQLVYVTNDGAKAPLAVKKRTHKAVDGWSERAAVRLPGSLPVILAEGPETALSIWQATGHETWACLGISNIGRAPVPEGADVIIARDGDEPGSKADGQVGKAAASLLERGHAVSIAAPPQGQDFNDVLFKKGADAVREIIAEAKPVACAASVHRFLDIGSDVEIAHRVRTDLIERFGEIVHAEGAFWRYCGTHWEPIIDHELRRAVHPYDGAHFTTPAGEPSLVKLSKARIDSVLNECAALCADPTFYEKRPIGINCASGFIRFADDGSASIELHDRAHRCRHTLPGRWQLGASGVPPEHSLLHRLIHGVFHGDGDAAQKMNLLAEISGSAALGFATKLKQPRAVILFGQTAENGKSQILDLVRGLLPPSAVCSVPAARMGDERHIIGLVGKLLNATDELSAGAIASDTFKSVVTGEPVEGRDVYKSRIEFRPEAQNLFATNGLPPFQGGMDRGVQRRLLVILFNRTIPMEERVENIGRRIAEEEADLLLAWAVEGASRLVRERNFTIPASCKQALADWIFGADPVLAWLGECVDLQPIVNGLPAVMTRKAFEHFHAWAIAEGFRKETVPGINGFVQRVKANKEGVEYHRTGNGRFFQGMLLKQQPGPLPF
jgi:P4 family phage/plasmid primase-like protien